MASGDTKTQQYLDIAANGTRADVQHGCCETRTQSLIMDVADRIITEEETRAVADQALQQEIDDLHNSPDVVDIVPTYAALQDYDTSGLGDKDVIRVLADETHDGQSTYYRWDAADEEFDYIGAVGDYYTKTQVDDLLDEKQDILTAGENITIEDESGSLVISATGGSGGGGITELTSADYNRHTSGSTDDGVALWLLNDGLYTVAENQLGVYFSGARSRMTMGEGTIAQVSTYSSGVKQIGLIMPDGAFWSARVTSSTGAESNFIYMLNNGSIVQSTGTSTTNVMSQNAVSSMVFADPGTNTQIKIGSGAVLDSVNSIAIGSGALAQGDNSFRSSVIGFSAHSDKQDATALGAFASVSGTGSFGVAIGRSASCTKKGAVALGAHSNVTYDGEVNIGSTNTSYGYNSSNYRLLTGLYDGQSAHDAVTLGQLNGRVLQNAGAPTTSTVGSVGTLYEDTTNGKLYICTAADTVTPSYTWAEVSAGGGGGGVVELTSADYNYPTNNPTTIGLWLLPPGTYYTATGVKTRISATGSDSTAGFNFEIGNIDSNKRIIRYQNSMGTMYATWNIVSSSGVNQGFGYITTAPLQTTGTSTTEVMSQNAVTSMVFADPGTNQKVRIGDGAGAPYPSSVALGASAQATGQNASALGAWSRAAANTVAFYGGSATTKGVMQIGLNMTGFGTLGYNDSEYRLLTGLYDPQSAHDAATKGYVDTLVGDIDTALDIILNGEGS